MERNLLSDKTLHTQIPRDRKNIILYVGAKIAGVFFCNALHDGNAVTVGELIGFGRLKPVARGMQPLRVAGIFTAKIEEASLLPERQGQPPHAGFQMGAGF